MVCAKKLGIGPVNDMLEKMGIDDEQLENMSDELTGLIGAAALMRPSKSTTDMELSSVKKKFKDKKFAAGCSREVIKDGADLLGWELDTLILKTLTAMQQSEAGVREELAKLVG